jgi:NhaP-type Na+/H+ or K+/H+ antiporter
VFLIIVIDKGLPGSGTMAVTVVLTVTLSVLLHEVTAKPLVTWFAGATNGHSGDGEQAECDSR